MKNWAIVHTASGAIVAITSVKAFPYREGLEVIAAPLGITSADNWWDGAAFVAREAAAITAPVDFAEAGAELAIERPAGAWISLTDGTVTNTGTLTVLGGYKENRFALVGRYRGETAIGVVSASAEDAMAAVREERDRRLVASDKFVLPDFPLSETVRSDWIAYRQALRLIPELQPHCTLATVKWPSMPEAAA